MIITLSELEIKDLKNLNKFLDDPSNIMVGITDDAILIILEKSIKSLVNTFSSTKYEFIYISDLGTFLINQDELKTEFNENLENNDQIKYFVKIENKKGDEI